MEKLPSGTDAGGPRQTLTPLARLVRFDRKVEMSRSYDSIIIGSGQAGPFLATRLAGAGRSVVLVERKFLGGTCVNTGCTRTKAMVACAKVAHQVRDAARFGVHAEGDAERSRRGGIREPSLA